MAAGIAGVFMCTPAWSLQCSGFGFQEGESVNIDPDETLRNTAGGCLGASSAAVSRRCNYQSRQSPPRMKRVWHWVAAKRPLELACCSACSVAAPGVDVHTYAGHPQGRPRCACCSRPIPVPNTKRSRYRKVATAPNAHDACNDSLSRPSYYGVAGM